MQVSTIGIDLAKSIFQVCGFNQAGKPVFNKKLRRPELLSFVSRHRGAVVAMEACCGSNFWARAFGKLGFEVKLIPPQFVKPFVKTNKSDFADAEAICEASLRPTMRFSSVKTIEQQDLAALHKVRQRFVRSATALSNEIRGFLAERGIVIRQGRKPLVEWYRGFLTAPLPDEVTLRFKEILDDLFAELAAIDEKIENYDTRIAHEARTNPTCVKLQSIPGVGPITATAITALVGNPHSFKSGRHFAANLGLTPRHSGSGGKTVNLSISKRGNSYLRCMLIQGAHSVIMRLKSNDENNDRLRSWAYRIQQRRGKYKAVVALANKNARIIYAVLKSENGFDVAKAAA